MSVESRSCVCFRPHGVLRHTHTAEATAVAQFSCLWRQVARYSSTPPFLCAGRTHMSSAVTGSHLALKNTCKSMKTRATERRVLHPHVMPKQEITSWPKERMSPLEVLWGQMYMKYLPLRRAVHVNRTFTNKISLQKCQSVKRSLVQCNYVKVSHFLRDHFYEIIFMW